MRQESNDPSAWPVAPVPWLQPEEDPRDPNGRIISSIEAPNPASIGASLFEDSWGKPLENTGGDFDDPVGGWSDMVSGRSMGKHIGVPGGDVFLSHPVLIDVRKPRLEV